MAMILIGYYDVPEEIEHTNRDYSCAAWWETIKVAPGKYPVFSTGYDVRYTKAGKCEVSDQLETHGVYVHLEGTITADYFGTLYFGMPVSNYDEKKNAGRKSRHSLHYYAYSLANEILEGRSPVTLLPEFEAREIKFHSTISGDELTTYGIFKIA